MFSGRNTVGSIADGGGQGGVHNPLDPGRDDRPVDDIGAKELDAGVDRRRFDGQINGSAGVEADTAAAYSAFNGNLVWLYWRCMG